MGKTVISLHKGVGSPESKHKVSFVASLHKSLFGASSSDESTAKQSGVSFRGQTQTKIEVSEV